MYPSLLFMSDYITHVFEITPEMNFSIYYVEFLFFADFHQREPESYSPVHVINIDITDNAEEATLGAFQICDLCERVSWLFVLLL